MLKYRQILSFHIHLFRHLSTFLGLLAAQIVLSQDAKLMERRNAGIDYRLRYRNDIDYFDASENLKNIVEERQMIASHVYHIKGDCGNLCNTTYASEHTLHQVSKGKYVPKITKKYECKDLFKSPLFEQTSRNLTPNGANSIPRLDELPEEVAHEFTYGGRVELLPRYMIDPSSSSSVWTKKLIQNLRLQFRNNILFGGYGKLTVQEISRHIDSYMIGHINGGHILVIGSKTPWIEAILLEKGAKRITVLDYGEIKTDHPDIRIFTPYEIREMYLEGTFQSEMSRFDAMISFSSLEHSGLGRYGDAINPWGDLIAMAKTKCITKKNSFALVGVPSQFEHPGFKEYIGFNAGRVYGILQLSHLFANWDQVYTEAVDKYVKLGANQTTIMDSYLYQPIYILQNV